MKINASIRGGASDGLGYAPLFKELTLKPWITFGILAGTSFGAIATAMIAMGWDEKRMKSFLLSFVGDYFMKLEQKAESGHFLKRLLFAPVLFATKTFIWNDLLKKARQFDWTKTVRADKVYLCFLTQTEMGRVFGLDVDFSFLDLWKIIKSKDGNKLADELHPYYASDDGIYKYDLKNGFHKVSDKIMPMGQAVLASFWNPAFRTLKTPIGAAFDGGLCNNECNLVHSDKDFYQFACTSADKRPSETASDLNGIYYNKNRPADDRCFFFPPKELNAFFAFDNANILQAWGCQPSNVLPEQNSLIFD